MGAPKFKGSAAVRQARMPRSAERLYALASAAAVPAADRRRIRRVLSRRLPRIASQLQATVESIEAPDPEAAVVYLAMLRDACDRAIAAAAPKYP